jgi:hypothetical protein
MSLNIKPPVLGPAADWATAEHQAYKELPIKSHAAILIVWRVAAALNAKFRLRNEDDVDVSIEGGALIVSQQDFPAEVQPTEDDSSRDEKRLAGIPSAAVSIASARTAGGDFAANGPGDRSAAVGQSSGNDAASRYLRVGAAAVPKPGKVVRPNPVPKLVRPHAKPTPSPVASGDGAAAFATTLFAAIAVCCMLVFVLRHFDKSASSTSTNAVPQEGAGHTTNRPHARQQVNASESRRDQQR